MKLDPTAIWSIWNAGGPYIGDNAPHAVVTVEKDWFLNTGTAQPLATMQGPVRYWRYADDSQVETVVPNVQSISWDKSLEADADTCSITIMSQKMDSNNAGDNESLGTPGYYGPGHGAVTGADSRWGYTTNEWSEVLVPNALIRTYQGYGGQDKTLTQALTDGNLTITGTWLIDEVQERHDGTMEITCRSMAKLLIDQFLYKGLVPASEYPLTFSRWDYDNTDVRSRTATFFDSLEIGLSYHNSSIDEFVGSPGSNTPVHNHYPADSIDRDNETYTIGGGHTDPTAADAYDWWQYGVGAPFSEVFIYPWAGNFDAYISVYENGAWVGDENVPGTSVPYVLKVGIPWEKKGWYVLPRTYDASHFRITLRNPTKTTFAPGEYRTGLREVRIRISNTEEVANRSVDVAVYEPNSEGYWILSTTGLVSAYGDARHVGESDNPAAGFWREIHPTSSGLGYYVMTVDGDINAYGDATDYGSPKSVHGAGNATVGGMALSWDGDGYWTVDQDDGRVDNFGPVPDYTDIALTGGTILAAMASHPTSDGFWVVDVKGRVTTRGAAVDYGEPSPLSDTRVVDIVATSTGNGYWIVNDAGKVWAFGDATHLGDITTGGGDIEAQGGLESRILAMAVLPDDSAYALLSEQGVLYRYPFGDFPMYGSPAEGYALLRSPGNIMDYSEIIRAILAYCGWWFYDGTSNGRADIYGIIEETGAWPVEELPQDMFDKAPPIDPIREITEALGYQFRIGDDGEANFVSPNIYAAGNYDENRNRSSLIPSIDERQSLTGYQAIRSNKLQASTLIITSNIATDLGGEAAAYKPLGTETLRGMIRPFAWENRAFNDEAEREIMAAMISLQIWLSQRVGQAEIVANPCIQPDDQIRIWERTTGEGYIHYVRGIQCNQDLQTGAFTMQLTTNWMGTGDDWLITALTETLSDPVQEWLELQTSYNYDSTTKPGGVTKPGPTWVVQ